MVEGTASRKERPYISASPFTFKRFNRRDFLYAPDCPPNVREFLESRDFMINCEGELELVVAYREPSERVSVIDLIPINCKFLATQIGLADSGLEYSRQDNTGVVIPLQDHDNLMHAVRLRLWTTPEEYLQANPEGAIPDPSKCTRVSMAEQWGVETYTVATPMGDNRHSPAYVPAQRERVRSW